MATTLKLEEDDKVKADALYRKTMLAAGQSSEGKAKLFTPQELLDFDIVSDLVKLLPLLQHLIDHQYFKAWEVERRTLYSVRARDVADRLQKLAGPDLHLYGHIEEAGVKGTWTKSLRGKINLPQQVVNKSIKVLEGRDLIRPVKNIKNPAQKSYILSHLEPGEEVTGGPWHTDGELDLDLIGITAEVIMDYVGQQSWIKGSMKVERQRSISPIAPLSEEGAGDSIANTGEKRSKSVAEAIDIEDLAVKPHKKRSRHDRIETQIAYPPRSHEYPKVNKILEYVREAGFIKDSSSLKDVDIQAVLDVLVLDGRLEIIGNGYRTVRGMHGASAAMKGSIVGGNSDKVDDEHEGTGLTQVPCGRCPVFELCEEGGPVNARNCVYFDNWLRA